MHQEQAHPLAKEIHARLQEIGKPATSVRKAGASANFSQASASFRGGAASAFCMARRCTLACPACRMSAGPSASAPEHGTALKAKPPSSRWGPRHSAMRRRGRASPPRWRASCALLLALSLERMRGRAGARARGRAGARARSSFQTGALHRADQTMPA